MRMKQGEGYTIEEAGRLSSEKGCAFLISLCLLQENSVSDSRGRG